MRDEYEIIIKLNGTKVPMQKATLIRNKSIKIKAWFSII